jgi:hypothetical protein
MDEDFLNTAFRQFRAEQRGLDELGPSADDAQNAH